MDTLTVSIAVGLIVSLLFTEMFGLSAGGMIVPGYLAIYYGWPSLVNGAGGNITLAADYFDDFDIIVHCPL